MHIIDDYVESANASVGLLVVCASDKTKKKRVHTHNGKYGKLIRYQYISHYVFRVA